MTLKGLVALLGLGMVGIGTWLLSPPAAWIVVGFALFGVALIDAAADGRRRRS